MKNIHNLFTIGKIGASIKPNLKIEFNKASNKWHMETESSVKKTSTSFEINKEFEEESQDGDRKIQSIVTIENNKMIQTQREKEKILCIITRNVNQIGEQIVIFKADNVEAKRIFHRRD